MIGTTTFTIFYWDKSEDIGVMGLILTLTLVVIWFYFVGWIGNSRRFHRLQKFVNEHDSSDLMVVLYNERLNELNDTKILREIGFKLYGIHANTNNKDSADYIVYFILNKKEIFVVKVDNGSIGCCIANKNTEDQDLVDEWINLEYGEYAGKTYKEIFSKIYEFYLEHKSIN
ncbi:MAG: hypothetical protein BGN88_02865 [Clostridiales bacterium 43-6]|nr:MAG: hypothetical protein BGN88_02865 [Clostridiales bacterium 43-6]